MSEAPWWYWQDEALYLRLHVQPGAKRDEIVGPHGEALKVRITAPPVEGKANAHLCKFLAGCTGVNPKSVTLVKGRSTRQKIIMIRSPLQLLPGIDRP
jgi:uncharacterized protein (TIGR00251 family)